MKLAKLFLAIFLFFLLALCFSSLATEREEETKEVDPELKTCKHQCKHSESDKQVCMEKCEKYHDMKKEREREIEKQVRRKKKHEMEEKCHHHHSHTEEEENPFVFDDEDFDTRVDTENGRVWVLKKFTKKSKLLRGIQNFRLAILEAKAHTFVTPRHFDSQTVVFNAKGRGIIGLVREDKTERFNLERGDIMRIPAGTPVYVVNREENENLFLANFHIPVSTPGHFEEFFGLGGRDPESILTAFSWKVLEAALKTSRGKLEKLFDQQREGSILKISKEDVRGLAPKRVIWPFGGQKGPFNLFSKSPSFSNQYGRLFEVGPFDEKSGLQGLNLMLTFVNITNGSISTVMYNTHATKIGLVIEGKGNLEMACPHVSSSRRESESEEEKSSPSYHRISGRLRPGVVFVVPAGHPFVTIASNKNNLIILCFEVNAQGNKKFTFAGKNNVVSALDKNAKKLAFNYPAQKVDEIFDREEQFFFPASLDTFKESEEQEERGRTDS